MEGPYSRLIGEYDPTLGQLHIDDIGLEWGPYNWTYQEDTTFPYHRCSAPCPAAHFKVVGDQFCCWQCFACRKNEIIVDNETSCELCPDKQWPIDENQLECTDIPQTFLGWRNLYGATLAGLSGCGLFLTLVITIITIRKRYLRVIKGSGLHMLLVILTGVYLSFTTVIVHIFRPHDGLCIFGRAGFHMSMTLIFGPMLVKTNRIFQIYAASKKSRKEHLASDVCQRVSLAIIIVAQVCCKKLPLRII